MPAQFIAADGTPKKFDLDEVVDVVEGLSGKRKNWNALIVYSKNLRVFIELRDAPPDFRGNSPSECEEVNEQYIESVFGITAQEIAVFKNSPKSWRTRRVSKSPNI